MALVLIVGAGISGLSLARALHQQGDQVTVLERSRGVGGRCATRRVDGIPVDHGAAFLHGAHPFFLEAIESIPDVRRLSGWPARREGHGVPCQPQAFSGSETRLAIAEGVSRFPKHLARGLDVRTECAATALAFGEPRGAGELAVRLASGESLQAPTVVLAMPPPQARRLFEPLLEHSTMLTQLQPVLGLPRTVPCLALIACYEDTAPRPAWEAGYPEEGPLQAIFVDSSKRGQGVPLTLVLQARAAYSRDRLGAGETEEAAPLPYGVTQELLGEAAHLYGDWISKPRNVQTHRWLYARVDRTSELASPILVTLENGALLGFCGDAFRPEGGLEGAYLSGLVLARLLSRRRAHDPGAETNPTC